MSTQNVERELNYCQKQTTKPRPVYYTGPKKNMEPEIARDIITLYMFGQLGHSPIRLIMGLDDDKPIEDVIRQHMLGRKGVVGEQGELVCPSQKFISEEAMFIVKLMVKKYKTEKDEEVQRILHRCEWRDVPVKKKVICCLNPDCGMPRTDLGWNSCPWCGTSYTPSTSIGSQKQLFNVDSND